MKLSTKAVLVRAALLIILMVMLTVMASPEAKALQYFELSEFRDRHNPTLKVEMDHDFLLKLDELRKRVGFPIHINSGYRSPKHPDEIHKAKPGTHNKGIAVDIKAITPYKRQLILRHARALGFTGIGIYPRHIHLDTRKTKRVIWVRKSYNVNQARDSPRR